MPDVAVGVKTSPRFRIATMSLLADTISFDDIQRVFVKWDKGIKGGAVILHDKDTYSERDAKRINQRINEEITKIKLGKALYATQDEYNAAIKAELDKKVMAGSPKPSHWHILLSFGTNAKSVEDIAKAFGCAENMVVKVNKGLKGFTNMLAYFTHITDEAREEGKYEYSPDEVKLLVFPDDEAFNGFANYEMFADAFAKNSIMIDLDAKAVMFGRVHPLELKEKKPDYYLNNFAKVQRARLEYVNSLPTPSTLFNFYVGAAFNTGKGSSGRIGKGLACQILAVSHLKSMFPDVKFESMTLDDLKAKYVFYAGNEGVTFDGYDGQPIVIWEDIRGYDLIKIFGGINRLFKALDTHPKPVNFNVKYGKIQLKNRINIFNGTQLFTEFIEDLSSEYRKEIDKDGNTVGGFHVKEDKSQAEGRFPFFMEVSPSFVTIGAQLEYLVGTKDFDFKYTVENNLVTVAQHNLLFENTDWVGQRFLDVENKVVSGDIYKKTLPAELFKSIDLQKDYEYFCEHYKDSDKIERRPAWTLENMNNGMCPVTYETWYEHHAPCVYDSVNGWHRPTT